MVRQPLLKIRLNAARSPRVVATILLLGLLIIVLLGGTNTAAENRTDEWQHFKHLLDFIRMEDRQDPLVIFTLNGDGVDSTLSRENRRFISQNKRLLENMRTELNSDALNWQLREARKRLMVVPEKHPEYAALFENYCHTVIDYVLQKTGLPNPYQAITTLNGPPSDPILSEDGGITAYLVHNIADVYSEEYEFFADINADRKIRITLDNRVYLGEIGSYSSFLVVNEDQQYTFEHSPYTLWRNSAENPLNVFIAPIEETLHIALRGATEEAIRTRLTEKPPSTRADIEGVVEEWLAVEEAVVGGLVSALLPDILDRFLEGDATADIVQTLSERRAFDKYRFLDQGIEVINALGLQSAIAIYLEQTPYFKALLIPPAAEIPTTLGDYTSGASTNEPTV